jgi:beta-1,4-mannooligosaccharide/beta-1,4-mannosyl-N-acetylglucosamine phosphorylase
LWNRPANDRFEKNILSRQKKTIIGEAVENIPCEERPRGSSDADTGRIAIYYGCADTVAGRAFAQVDELIDYIKDNSEL